MTAGGLLNLGSPGCLPPGGWSGWKEPRRSFVLRLLPLLLGLVLGGAPALAGQHVPLECRLDAGAWTHCTMKVERIGEHWWITSGDQRIEFRHDGRGKITMRRQRSSQWQAVQANWSADATLCWDGICARGEIPLD